MYQWGDRPAERVTLTRPRARITDPNRGAIIPAGQSFVVRGKAWFGTGAATNNAIEVGYVGGPMTPTSTRRSPPSAPRTSTRSPVTTTA